MASGATILQRSVTPATPRFLIRAMPVVVTSQAHAPRTQSRFHSQLAPRTLRNKGSDWRPHYYASIINDFLPHARSTETLRISDLEAPHTGIIKLIEMNRPKAKNAISRQLLKDLSHEVEAIHEEKDASQARAVILASAPDDVFCAGADLKERKSMSQGEVQDFLMTLRHTFSRLASSPIPTIAAVSGSALGGGLELALCCHFRVFSDNAVVGLPETRLAIIPGAGGTFRLAQAIGQSRAREMILTGRRFGGLEASLFGLCHRLSPDLGEDSTVEPSELTPDQSNLMAKATALKLAEEIANGGPIAIRAALQAIDGSSQEAENAAYETILQTKDRTEALRAFAEKRKPEFKGE